MWLSSNKTYLLCPHCLIYVTFYLRHKYISSISIPLNPRRPHPTHVGRCPCSPQSLVCTRISLWGPASLRLRCSTSWAAQTPQRHLHKLHGPPPAPFLLLLLCRGTGPSCAQSEDTSCRRPWLRPKRYKHPGLGRPGRNPFYSSCWCLALLCSASRHGHQRPPVNEQCIFC